MKNLLIIPLLFIACALHAQTKPTTADSLKQAMQIIQELQTEKPMYLIVFSTKRKLSNPVFVTRGFMKGGTFSDSQHKPLPQWITVLSAVARKEDKKP